MDYRLLDPYRARRALCRRGHASRAGLATPSESHCHDFGAGDLGVDLRRLTDRFLNYTGCGFALRHPGDHHYWNSPDPIPVVGVVCPVVLWAGRPGAMDRAAP